MDTKTFELFKNTVENKHYNFLLLLVILFQNQLEDDIMYKKIVNSKLKQNV